MITANLETIRLYTDGELRAAEHAGIECAGVSTDTRSIRKGSLFVPLIGERFNGHAFVGDALAHGACAALWQRDQGEPPEGAAVVVVDDTLSALQRLAAEYRRSLPVKVIGITGSNGKTTTKDMVAVILETTYKVHKTSGNFNNHIGLPLTLLSLEPDTEYAVLEMGMRARGEIELLSAIARPDIALITNIGEAHLLHLGSRDEIARAKLEIVTGMKEDGTVVLPGDEPLIDKYIQEVVGSKRFNAVRFGESERCDLSLAQASVGSDATSFTLRGSTREYNIPMLGKHNAVNALAAVAVGRIAGVSEERIAAGLKELVPTGMRIERVAGRNGTTLWNDAYNASPSSMRAALELLAAASVPGRKFAVLADMLELGPDEAAYHRAIGETLTPETIDYVFTYGPLARYIAEGAAARYEAGRVEALDSKQALIRKVEALMGPGDLILVKGSRGMKLEETIQSWQAEA